MASPGSGRPPVRCAVRRLLARVLKDDAPMVRHTPSLRWWHEQSTGPLSVRTNAPMHASNLGFRVWLLAMYLMVTNLKGTSSMKLHRDLGVIYRTAWHLSHRIREAWADQQAFSFFDGPVEVDETYIGGKAKNMHAKDRERRIHRSGRKRQGCCCRREGSLHRGGHRRCGRADTARLRGRPHSTQQAGVHRRGDRLPGPQQP